MFFLKSLKKEANVFVFMDTTFFPDTQHNFVTEAFKCEGYFISAVQIHWDKSSMHHRGNQENSSLKEAVCSTLT